MLDFIRQFSISVCSKYVTRFEWSICIHDQGIKTNQLMYNKWISQLLEILDFLDSVPLACELWTCYAPWKLYIFYLSIKRPLSCTAPYNFLRERKTGFHSIKCTIGTDHVLVAYVGTDPLRNRVNLRDCVSDWGNEHPRSRIPRDVIRCTSNYHVNCSLRRIKFSDLWGRVPWKRRVDKAIRFITLVIKEPRHQTRAMSKFPQNGSSLPQLSSNTVNK